MAGCPVCENPFLLCATCTGEHLLPPGVEGIRGCTLAAPDGQHALIGCQIWPECSRQILGPIFNTESHNEEEVSVDINGCFATLFVVCGGGAITASVATLNLLCAKGDDVLTYLVSNAFPDNSPMNPQNSPILPHFLDFGKQRVFGFGKY